MAPPADQKSAPWLAKFFTCGLLRDDAKETFQKLVINLMEFKHPGVDPIVGTLSYEGAIVLFYEYPEGPSIETALAGLRPKAPQAIEFSRQLIEIDSVLQNSNMIHGNIYPRAIRIVDGKVRLGQLGVVGVLEILDVDLAKIDFGDKSYKSPQQLKNPKEPDFSWDRFATSTLCYRIASGEPVTTKAAGKGPLKKTNVNPIKALLGFSPGKKYFQSKAFHSDPAKQFASAEEIEKAFKKWPKIDLVSKLAALVVPLILLTLVIVLIARTLNKKDISESPTSTNGSQQVQNQPAILKIESDPSEANVYLSAGKLVTAEMSIKTYNVPPGSINITVSAPGYTTASETIKIEPGSGVSRKYMLRKQFFADDFDNNNNRWIVGNSGGVTASVESGIYKIQGEGIAGHAGKLAIDKFELSIALSIEQVNPGSEMGILFFYQDNDNYAQLMINSEKGCFLDRKIQGNLNPLGKMTGAECVGEAKFKINIKSQQDKLIVSVNDKKIVTSTGSSFGAKDTGDIAFKVFADGILKVESINLLELPK